MGELRVPNNRVISPGTSKQPKRELETPHTLALKISDSQKGEKESSIKAAVKYIKENIPVEEQAAFTDQLLADLSILDGNSKQKLEKALQQERIINQAMADEHGQPQVSKQENFEQFLNQAVPKSESRTIELRPEEMAQKKRSKADGLVKVKIRRIQKVLKDANLPAELRNKLRAALYEYGRYLYRIREGKEDSALQHARHGDQLCQQADKIVAGLRQGLKETARNCTKNTNKLAKVLRRLAINNIWERPLKDINELAKKPQLSREEEKRLQNAVLTMKQLSLIARAGTLLNLLKDKEIDNNPQFSRLNSLYKEFRENYMKNPDSSLQLSRDKISLMEEQTILAEAEDCVLRFRNGDFFNLVFVELGYSKEIKNALDILSRELKDGKLTPEGKKALELLQARDLQQLIESAAFSKMLGRFVEDLQPYHDKERSRGMTLDVFSSENPFEAIFRQDGDRFSFVKLRELKRSNSKEGKRYAQMALQLGLKAVAEAKSVGEVVNAIQLIQKMAKEGFHLNQDQQSQLMKNIMVKAQKNIKDLNMKLLMDEAGDFLVKELPITLGVTIVSGGIGSIVAVKSLSGMAKLARLVGKGLNINEKSLTVSKYTKFLAHTTISGSVFHLSSELIHPVMGNGLVGVEKGYNEHVVGGAFTVGTFALGGIAKGVVGLATFSRAIAKFTQFAAELGVFGGSGLGQQKLILYWQNKDTPLTREDVLRTLVHNAVVVFGLGKVRQHAGVFNLPAFRTRVVKLLYKIRKIKPDSVTAEELLWIKTEMLELAKEGGQAAGTSEAIEPALFTPEGKSSRVPKIDAGVNNVGETGPKVIIGPELLPSSGNETTAPMSNLGLFQRAVNWFARWANSPSEPLIRPDGVNEGLTAVGRAAANLAGRGAKAVVRRMPSSPKRTPTKFESAETIVPTMAQLQRAEANKEPRSLVNNRVVGNRVGGKTAGNNGNDRPVKTEPKVIIEPQLSETSKEEIALRNKELEKFTSFLYGNGISNGNDARFPQINNRSPIAFEPTVLGTPGRIATNRSAKSERGVLSPRERISYERQAIKKALSAWDELSQSSKDQIAKFLHTQGVIPPRTDATHTQKREFGKKLLSQASNLWLHDTIKQNEANRKFIAVLKETNVGLRAILPSLKQPAVIWGEEKMEVGQNREDETKTPNFLPSGKQNQAAVNQ